MQKLIYALLLASSTAVAQPTICEDIGTITEFYKPTLLDSKTTVIMSQSERYTYSFIFNGDVEADESIIGKSACYDHKRNKFCTTGTDAVPKCFKVIVDNKEDLPAPKGI